MTETTDIKALTNERLLEIKSILSGFEDGYDTVDDKENYEAMRGAQLLIDELISLRGQLEAERWNVGVLEGVIARKEFDAQQAEISSLRGTQEPVAWTDAEELRGVEKQGCGYLFKIDPANPYTDSRRQIMLYRCQPKPVVVLPDGWKLVPAEPTKDMLKAGCQFASEHNTNGSWRQMLAAAPSPATAGIVVKDGE